MLAFLAILALAFAAQSRAFAADAGRWPKNRHAWQDGLCCRRCRRL